MTDCADGTAPSAAPTRVSIRVRYAETDQMGVGYHGAYLPWLEVARTRWLHEHAVSYRELEAGGVHLPVIEVRCRYLQPTHYDDELMVEAAAYRYRRSGIGFEYRVVRPADGKLVATAETRHAAVGPDGRPRRLPIALRDALERSIPDDVPVRR
ncbi:MAG: acyl-CoA thioesterase [Acidobacteria bacterium]|nr:thioesterase family protein [Acidobacteriota bacterium]MXX85618.1 acyl-CoA thioesterase [Acidobacteriota bacterium]MYG75868.1 acyl-CoA thioesterase [Acidobacteriota bacterium]